MSRSRKKTPRCGDRKDKELKRYANRKLRHRPIEEDNENEFRNSSYKKNFPQWDICDWETVGETFEQYYQFWLNKWHAYGKYLNKPYPNREELKKEYDKWYTRK